MDVDALAGFDEKGVIEVVAVVRVIFFPPQQAKHDN